MVEEKLLQFFPHEKVREEQDRLIGDLHSFLQGNDKTMLFQGDAGLGKESAVASQVLLHANEFDKIVYLIPKDTGKINIEKELQLIGTKGNPIDYVVLYSKERLCNLFNETKKDFKEKIEAQDLCKVMKKECPFFKDGVCAYYNCIEHALIAKIVVCDYNYVLSPLIRPFFWDKVKDGKVLLVINEIHNAPERALESMQRKLSSHTLNKAVVEGKVFLPAKSETAKFLHLLELKMNNLVLRKKVEMQKAVRADFTPQSELFFNELFSKEDLRQSKNLIKIGERIAKQKAEKKIGVVSYIERLGRFMSFWDRTKPFDYYLYYLEKYGVKGKEGYLVCIACLNPYPLIKAPFTDANKLILYSATCYPERYLKMFVLKKFGAVFIPPPYKSPLLKNRKDFFYFDGKLTKKFREDNKYLSKTANEVNELLLKAEPPIVVWAVSPLWKRIKPLFETKFDFLEEPQNMAQKDKKEFIEKITNAKYIALSPYGSFAQSIDLSGIKTTIMLGVPDPLLDLVNRKRIDYFKKRFLRRFGIGAKFAAFLIISRLPAIEKSVQAMSRPLRKETDSVTGYWIDKRWVREQRFIQGVHKGIAHRIDEMFNP